MTTHLISSSEVPGDGGERIQLLVDFWNDIHVCGDPGAATWEELERFEQLITDALAQRPPDVDTAESLTAHVILLIAGGSGL